MMRKHIIPQKLLQQFAATYAINALEEKYLQSIFSPMRQEQKAIAFDFALIDHDKNRVLLEQEAETGRWSFVRTPPFEVSTSQQSVIYLDAQLSEDAADQPVMQYFLTTSIACSSNALGTLSNHQRWLDIAELAAKETHSLDPKIFTVLERLKLRR